MAHPEKTYLPLLSSSQEANFSCNYRQLQAGINRLRYIKKKQQRHHNAMAEHLQNMLNKIQQQQHSSSSTSVLAHLPPPPRNLPSTASIPIFKYNLQENSPYSSKSSKGFKAPLSQLARSQSGFGLLLTKDQDKTAHEASTRPQTKVDSEKRLFSRQQNYMKKQENCQEMKELRIQRQHKKKEQFQQRIALARQRKAQLLQSQQEGKKKMEEQYYRHIEHIKAQKRAERERKSKQNEMKCKRLMEIQKQEEEELAQFEKSLVLEESLRQYLVGASHSSTSGLWKDALNTDATFV